VSGILDFDSEGLKHLIKKYGIQKTWVSLLATHLNATNTFKYILNQPEFTGAKIFPGNLLEALSIGEIGVLYEYSVTVNNSRSRKSNGQFFTPDDVAQFMASFSKKFSKGIWLDPCSGIGNLSWHLVGIQDEPEEFLINNLILSDKDDLALLIARTLLTISYQNKHENLFNEIKNNFICFDFLSVADEGDLVLFDQGDKLSKIPKHDFVIVNPPYLALRADKRFETAKASDLYAYFLENIIKTSEGFISITPQSFTNAKKFESLRKLLLDKFSNLTIFNFDNVPANIFKGIKFGSKNTNKANSIRVSISIAIPGEGKKRITCLLRWRSSEREFLFANIESFLSEVDLTKDFFPKVSKHYESLYNDVSKNESLSKLVSSKKTIFTLYIPSSPRYFIVALKKRVKRGSIKQLYFRSEKDRDYAYLLINSSFSYWWWRLRDGGMTLSLETILSIPLLDFKLDKDLIQELEESEITNKVFKKNAGVKQYNVKHSQKLQLKLNKKLLPNYANLLSQLHENSEFTRLIKKQSNES
jgi:hypothetical protein